MLVTSINGKSYQDIINVAQYFMKYLMMTLYLSFSNDVRWTYNNLFWPFHTLHVMWMFLTKVNDVLYSPQLVITILHVSLLELEGSRVQTTRYTTLLLQLVSFSWIGPVSHFYDHCHYIPIIIDNKLYYHLHHILMVPKCMHHHHHNVSSNLMLWYHYRNLF